MLSILTLIGSATALLANTSSIGSSQIKLTCTGPSTVSLGSRVYIVSEATTLTVDDCSCTDAQHLTTRGLVESGHYDTTSTTRITRFVTIPCPTPTTLTYGSSTYVVTSATTLTVEDCKCTDVPTKSVTKSSKPSSKFTKADGTSVKAVARSVKAATKSSDVNAKPSVLTSNLGAAIVKPSNSAVKSSRASSKSEGASAKSKGASAKSEGASYKSEGASTKPSGVNAKPSEAHASISKNDGKSKQLTTKGNLRATPSKWTSISSDSNVKTSILASNEGPAIVKSSDSAAKSSRASAKSLGKKSAKTIAEQSKFNAKSSAKVSGINSSDANTKSSADSKSWTVRVSRANTKSSEVNAKASRSKSAQPFTTMGDAIATSSKLIATSSGADKNSAGLSATTSGAKSFEVTDDILYNTDAKTTDVNHKSIIPISATGSEALLKTKSNSTKAAHTVDKSSLDNLIAQTLAHSKASESHGETTTTDHSTKYVTIPCPTPTTLTYGSSTYTIIRATTLTLEDCGCTDISFKSVSKPTAPNHRINQPETTIKPKSFVPKGEETVTVNKSQYTTIYCSTPTVLSYGSSTYTITTATTLTVEVCERCTETSVSTVPEQSPSVYTTKPATQVKPSSHNPPKVNVPSHVAIPPTMVNGAESVKLSFVLGMAAIIANII